MRHVVWAIAGVSVLATCSVVQSYAEDSTPTGVPRMVRFSGTLQPQTAKAAGAAVEISFSIFKEESGGEPLWFETQTVPVDAQGHYDVLLGAMHPDGLPMDLFTSGEARWLSIMVGKVEQPRVLLVSVPYALKAADSESLGGKPATSFVGTEQLKAQVETALSDSKLVQRSLNTAVLASGGGDTPPAVINEVTPATFTCSSASNCITATQNSTGHAILGQSTAATGATFGVFGSSASSSGRGIYGFAGSTSGTNYGVRGQSSSTSGYGLYGLATATTGVTHGIAGSSSSTSGRGIFGDASAATGATFGILGQSASTSGVGLMGSAVANSGTTIGVRALVNSASGTGAVIDNLGGGKLISARASGFVEKFSVDSNGNVVTGGSVSAGSANFTGSVDGYSPSSYAIRGISTSNIGVWGSGGTNGVYGYSAGTAVFGQATGTGEGVRGYNLTYASVGILATQDGLGNSVGVNGTGNFGVRATGYARGVYATSTSGYGVYATGGLYGVYASADASQIGVYGTASGGYGVYAKGDNGVRGEALGYTTSSGVVGVGGTEGYGVYGQGGAYGVYSSGAFAASGSKSAVVALSDDRVVELYAVESPEVWFEDFGSTMLTNGVAHVSFEPTFQLTVNSGEIYYVFLTPNGETNGLYIAQKSANGFQIREAGGGKSNITVDYRIVAKRRGFEKVRMVEVDADKDAVAEVRKHGQARRSRPVLRSPKKPPVNNGPLETAISGGRPSL